MADSSQLNSVRRKALNKIEESEKIARYFFVATAVVEAAALIGYLWLMDFGDRLHWLLLVMAFLIYGTLAFGLLTLGAYTRHWILRVLTAIELRDEQAHIAADPDMRA